jgi:DNA polymerase III gamma/tau subunit
MSSSTQFTTKYRPDNFNQVIGNEEVIKGLSEAIHKSDCRHGFLFTGPAGVGKTTLARIVGKEINASIIEIDAASNSGVDDMRMVVEASGFSSITLQPNRLYIIDEAHNLSSKGWQPLLKLIEDAPPSIYIAFCTTDPKNIPDTIRRRCIPVPLRPLKPVEIQDLIIAIAGFEGWTIHNDVFMEIVMSADGSAGKALSYLEVGHSAQSREELSKMLLEVMGENDAAIKLCKYLMSGKREWRQVQTYMGEVDDYEKALYSMASYFTGAMARSEEHQAHEIWLMLQKFMAVENKSYDPKIQLWKGIGGILWGTIPF